MTSRTPKLDEFAFSEREQELLQAARQERMPAELSQSVRAALEQQLSAAPAGVAGKGLGAMHALRLKVALWGALGVVMVGSLAQVDWHGVLASRKQAGVVTAASSASAADGVPVSPAAADGQQPLAAETPQSTGVAPARRADPDLTDQLRLELALLEGARAALGRGALAEAATLLARYAARFEQGTLRPESEALQIELEMRRGQLQAARRLAAHFLAMYPEHPLRDRVRQLTRSVR